MAKASERQLELLLLACVRTRPAHGYAIIEGLKHRSDGVFALPESSVYPALHRLDREGLLESSWAEVNGRRRRLYKITPKGRKALGERTRAWMRFSQAMSAAVGEAT